MTITTSNKITRKTQSSSEARTTEKKIKEFSIRDFDDVLEEICDKSLQKIVVKARSDYKRSKTVPFSKIKETR